MMSQCERVNLAFQVLELFTHDCVQKSNQDLKKYLQPIADAAVKTITKVITKTPTE